MAATIEQNNSKMATTIEQNNSKMATTIEQNFKHYAYINTNTIYETVKPKLCRKDHWIVFY